MMQQGSAGHSSKQRYEAVWQETGVTCCAVGHLAVPVPGAWLVVIYGHKNSSMHSLYLAGFPTRSFRVEQSEKVDRHAAAYLVW
jgi:hypothetical protein